jgi:hypothetical protein
MTPNRNAGPEKEVVSPSIFTFKLGYNLLQRQISFSGFLSVTPARLYQSFPVSPRDNYLRPHIHVISQPKAEKSPFRPRRSRSPIISRKRFNTASRKFSGFLAVIPARF